ncbi:MAG: hypothetical protein Q9227_004861 [Pyrenula ochraceoflavens]
MSSKKAAVRPKTAAMRTVRSFGSRMPGHNLTSSARAEERTSQGSASSNLLSTIQPLADLCDLVAALEGSLLQQQQNNGIPPTTNVSPPTNIITPTSGPTGSNTPIENFTFTDQPNLPWDFPAVTVGDDKSLPDAIPEPQTSISSATTVGFPFDGTSVESSAGLPYGCFSGASDDMTLHDSMPGMKMLDSPETLYDNMTITDLMQADLDQLYFDRIHPFTPILHQRRYFSWRRLPAKTEAQVCLQHAMWTLAASVSAHYQSLGDSLYRSTRRELEALDLKDASLASIDVEQTQAWLLLAIHELMCVDFRRGWISAGRAFRLIQLNWLHDVDNPDMNLGQSDWVENEQKRRTFWMAYCLDRFVSIRTGSQLTFHEQVTIRLPSPERSFQNDTPVLTPYLSKVLTDRDPTNPTLTPFIECIIAAHLCGRALSHRQQTLSFSPSPSDTHPAMASDFWDRHNWLTSLVMQRLELLGHKYPPALMQGDPMLLFVGITLRTCVLHLRETMEVVVPQGAMSGDGGPQHGKRGSQGNGGVMGDWARRSAAAAQEIIQLTKGLSLGNVLKVHPLVSIPLSLCAEWFSSSPDLGDSFSKCLQEFSDAMRGLRRFQHLPLSAGDVGGGIINGNGNMNLGNGVSLGLPANGMPAVTNGNGPFMR